MARAPWERRFTGSISRDLYAAGVVFGPVMAAAPMISLGLSAATAGMSIIGASNAAAGQRAAGGIALQQAQIRQVQADQVARQDYDAANTAEAEGQRRGINDWTVGDTAAGRAQAVMAASGAGVDPKLLAAIKGKANYNAGVDIWSGADKARLLRNQGLLTSWAGDVGVGQGMAESRAGNMAADSTMVGGIAKAGLSLASKYGGDFKFGGTKTGDPYLDASPADQVRADVAAENPVA